MRELVYYIAVSLDGRIAGPDGDFSAFAATGDHMDLLTSAYRDALPAPALRALGLTPDLARFDTVVMGWNTYAVGLPFDVDDPYPHLRQHVVSRSHRDLPAHIELVHDPVDRVRALKREPGGSGIWLCGGGELAGALDAEIDRLVLKVNPILFGDGPSVFASGYAPRDFRLHESTAFASGVVVNEYVR